MVTQNGNEKSISEHILEIRYRPNPKILDYRGTWAESLSVFMNLTEWKVDNTRIDVFEKGEERSCFVSFRNCGFVIRNSPNQGYFPDQCIKFMKFLFEQKPFGDPIEVQRLGVRSRVANSFNGEFKELVKLYATRAVKPTQEILTCFNAELIDIGGALNFATNIGKINFSGGPMDENQLKQFFAFEKSPPGVALYIDIDYWLEPGRPMGSKEVLSLIKKYAQENWETHEKIQSLVLGQ